MYECFFPYTVFSRDVSLKLKTRLPPYWCTISVNMACDLACNEFVVEKKLKEIDKKRTVMFSEYAEKLDGNVKKRYVEKISEVGVDPLLIPDHKLDPECLPPIEASDLLSYLVLDTSYYTNKQFKAFRSLQAYNQMVSGFISSVQGTVLQKKYASTEKWYTNMADSNFFFADEVT